MASKQTIQNQIHKLTEQIKPSPFEVSGFIFTLDDSDVDATDHRSEQLRLGFLQSAKESEAFHKKFPSCEFVYLGADYLEFINI